MFDNLCKLFDNLCKLVPDFAPLSVSHREKCNKKWNGESKIYRAKLIGISYDKFDGCLSFISNSLIA